MAKKSSIEKNNRRAQLAKRYNPRRERLKAIARDRNAAPEERFEAQLKLTELPRNSSQTRIRNRCSLTGRPRGVYSKFGLGRNKLREATMRGDVPGLRKASW
jgi:small subunit ribosomal protein S14